MDVGGRLVARKLCWSTSGNQTVVDSLVGLLSTACKHVVPQIIALSTIGLH